MFLATVYFIAFGISPVRVLLISFLRNIPTLSVMNILTL